MHKLLPSSTAILISTCQHKSHCRIQYVTLFLSDTKINHQKAVYIRELSNWARCKWATDKPGTGRRPTDESFHETNRCRAI